MSTAEIKQAIEKNKVRFGIKQALKKPKPKKTFITKDARPETIEKLEKAKIKFEILKAAKSETAKELNLDFECEVFSLK